MDPFAFQCKEAGSRCNVRTEGADDSRSTTSLLWIETYERFGDPPRDKEPLVSHCSGQTDGLLRRIPGLTEGMALQGHWIPATTD